MTELPICPVCGQPVDINTEAHITEPIWPNMSEYLIKHHECPTKEIINE
jgi:hypothetical protein